MHIIFWSSEYSTVRIKNQTSQTFIDSNDTKKKRKYSICYIPTSQKNTQYFKKDHSHKSKPKLPVNLRTPNKLEHFFKINHTTTKNKLLK